MKVVSYNKDVEQISHSGKSIGGVTIEGNSLVRVMMSGELGQLVQLQLEKGFYHPRHRHQGEEAIGYVIKGHLLMGIGDQEYTLRDGDAWRHPDGVFHWTRAVDNTYAIELHCPPRPEEKYR